MPGKFMQTQSPGFLLKPTETELPGWALEICIPENLPPDSQAQLQVRITQAKYIGQNVPE